MVRNRVPLLFLLAAPGLAQVPHVDVGFPAVTLPPDVDVVVVREQYYGAGGVDLTAYGIGAGPVDYVQSIYVRFYHGVVGEWATARGRIAFPPGVTVLGVITNGNDLGGSTDDGVLTETDLIFGIGVNPDDYSAPSRGVTAFDQDYACLRSDGSVHYNLLSRNDTVTDFRIIVDYGSSFPSGTTCDVEHLAADVGMWMTSKADLHVGTIVGDPGGAILGSGDFLETHAVLGLPLIEGVAPVVGPGQSIDYLDSIFFLYGGGAMSGSHLHPFDLGEERNVSWMAEGGTNDPELGPHGMVYYAHAQKAFSYTDLVGGQHHSIFIPGVAGSYLTHIPGTNELLIGINANATEVYRVDVDTLALNGTFQVPLAELGTLQDMVVANGMLYLVGLSQQLVEMNPTTGAWTALTVNPPNGAYTGMQANAAGTHLFLLRQIAPTLTTAVDLYEIGSGNLTPNFYTSPQRQPVGITHGPGGWIYVSDNGNNGTGMRWLRAFDPVTGTEMAAWECADHFNSNGIVGNVVPGVGDVYCQEQAINSSGEFGWISVHGSDVVADNDFHLLAHRLPQNQNGYFLTSQATAFGQPPGATGFLCLAGPIGRFVAQTQNSGQAGRFSIQADLNAFPFGAGIAVNPGETWYFQAWFRDIGAQSNFTDAICITFQ